MARKDLVGQKFNMLTVLEYAYTKNKKAHWKCLCDCGNISYPNTRCLTSGHSKSCGCLNYQPSTITHGFSKTTPVYFVWKELRHRCTNPNHKSYKNYGGRGIKFCEEWNDFEVFYEWAIRSGYKEERLTNGKNKWTIDRIDNNGNYEPDNCRWITNEEQARNKRNVIFITHNKETKSLHEWCEIFNISFNVVYNRIHRYRWDFEKAIYTPIRKAV